MKIIAAIPARYQSVRFPGKPLALIKGKPMIERVYRQVAECRVFSDIMVVTDDQKIARTVESFGGKSVITSPEHSSGTERIWEMFSSSDHDGVVNIQGDEPVISKEVIIEVYKRLAQGIYTVVSAYYENRSFTDFLSEDVVKAVVNLNHEAIYFSRSPIPFTKENKFSYFHQHIGIYGYSREALLKFVNSPKSKLELTENLEQLRFLENSVSIYMVESKHPSIGVDRPSDIARIEKWLKSQ